MRRCSECNEHYAVVVGSIPLCPSHFETHGAVPVSWRYPPMTATLINEGDSISRTPEPSHKQSVCCVLLGIEVRGEDILHEGVTKWMVENGPFLAVVTMVEHFHSESFYAELTYLGFVTDADRVFTTITAAIEWIQARVSNLVDQARKSIDMAEQWARFP